MKGRYSCLQAAVARLYLVVSLLWVIIVHELKYIYGVFLRPKNMLILQTMCTYIPGAWLLYMERPDRQQHGSCTKKNARDQVRVRTILTREPSIETSASQEILRYVHTRSVVWTATARIMEASRSPPRAVSVLLAKSTGSCRRYDLVECASRLCTRQTREGSTR